MKLQGAGADMINHAAEIKLRAERRLGELLREQEKNRGGEHMHRSERPTSATPTLAEQGITKEQSSVWQAEASMPEPEQAVYRSDDPTGLAKALFATNTTTDRRR